MHADILKEKQYLPRVYCKNSLAKQNQMLQILMKETEGDTEIVRPSQFTCSSAPLSLTASVSPHRKVEKTEKLHKWSKSIYSIQQKAFKD